MGRPLRVLIIVENLAGSIRPPGLVGGDNAARCRPYGLGDLPQGTQLSAGARGHRRHRDLIATPCRSRRGEPQPISSNIRSRCFGNFCSR